MKEMVSGNAKTYKPTWDEHDQSTTTRKGLSWR